jgi:tetratricopeptide (TPR) repeat protein
VAAAALLGVAAGGAGPGDAPGRRAPGPEPRWLVEQGVRRLERGQHEAAERAFLAAALLAHDPALAAVAYHDLGVAALERGQPEAGRDAFLDALALDPARPDTRFNLEWTLRLLRARPPPPRPEPSPAESDARTRPPQPRGGPDAAARERSPVPRLDAAQRRRWLERVPDDPSFALRAASRAAGLPTRASGAVLW